MLRAGDNSLRHAQRLPGRDPKELRLELSIKANAPFYGHLALPSLRRGNLAERAPWGDVNLLAGMAPSVVAPITGGFRIVSPVALAACGTYGTPAWLVLNTLR